MVLRRSAASCDVANGSALLNSVYRLERGPALLRCADFFDAGVGACAARNWTAWAFRMAGSRPGKRASISGQRAVLRISTPWRSPRMRPFSRRILKCCDRVDLGMACLLMVRKVEQFCEQPSAAIEA